MTDLIVASVLSVYLIVGLARPSIAVMAYVWVDIIVPQKIAYGFIAGAPLSRITAGICLISLIINASKLNRLRDKSVTYLLLFFAAWVTLTTWFALYPNVAWLKWGWAFKTILAAVIIPLAINDKKELEGLIWVFLASVSFYTISAGGKTLMGGGGYGSRLIAGGDNSGISESSTLALAAIITLPLLLNLTKNSILIQNTLRLRLVLYSLLGSSVLTVVGSFARTGLVGLTAFAFLKVLGTKKKARVLILLLFSAVVVASFAPDAWFERMHTTRDVTAESSALGRIVVWKWTVHFSNSHFFGGGFNAYLANAGMLDSYHNNPNISFGTSFKAFHSVYFEVLGEHGYIGLLLFLSIIAITYLKLSRRMKDTKDEWVRGLAQSLKQSIVLFCVCGAFVGVAFQPILYLLVVFSISLLNIPACDLNVKDR